MIAAPTTYQVHFFCNTLDLKPSTDIITQLLQIFREEGLLPSTYHQVMLPSPPEVRLRLASVSNEWAIDFDMDRVTIAKNSIKPLGANMGLPEDFVQTALEYLRRILAAFPRKGNRISLVVGGLMDQMTEETLVSLYSLLFVPLRFYEQNPPYAWNSNSHVRISADLAGVQEPINVITQVNRVQGKFLLQSGLQFDRIQILTDINTFQEIMEPRFDIEATAAFYAKALQIHREILADLKERLNA
jgi:hypothetical protein